MFWMRFLCFITSFITLFLLLLLEVMVAKCHLIEVVVGAKEKDEWSDAYRIQQQLFSNIMSPSFLLNQKSSSLSQQSFSIPIGLNCNFYFKLVFYFISLLYSQ